MKLKDLANTLNLSLTTVSRALNGYPEVSEKTRQRVLHAAQRMGYTPNAVAKRLALGKSGFIGLIYPFHSHDLGDAQFLCVVDGIREVLETHGFELILISENPKAPCESYQRVIASGMVDGLIVARTQRHDPRLHLLQSQDFPFVAHGRSDLSGAYAWLDYDNEQGGRLAAERFLKLGHRHIAMLSADLSYSFAWQRRQGFLRVLQTAEVTPPSEYLHQGVFSRRSGYQAMQDLLQLPEPPSAIHVNC